MFNTELPSKEHLPALIHKLAEEGDIPIALQHRSREALLSRPSHRMAAGNDGKITHASVKRNTNNQAGRQCHHIHLKTCRKGWHGRTGCRLCMKAGKCFRTGCVLLQEMTQEEARQLAESCKASCWCSIPDDAFLPSEDDSNICHEIQEQHDSTCHGEDEDDADTISTTSTDDESVAPEQFFCENQAKTIGIAFKATRSIPCDLMPQTYTLLNILERQKPPPPRRMGDSTATG